MGLGPISPADVDVEIVYGSVTEKGLHDIYTAPMLLDGADGEGRFIFTGQVTMPQGTFGYTVRVRPGSPELMNRFELPLVTWAQRF